MDQNQTVVVVMVDKDKMNIFVSIYHILEKHGHQYLSHY